MGREETMMVWRRLFKRDEPEPPVTAPTLPPTAPTLPATRRHRRGDIPVARDPETQRALDQLRRRRETLVFDVERAISATQPDNLWRERIDLLRDSLASVEADLAALDQEVGVAGGLPPATPIVAVVTTADAPMVVRFTIGGESFEFQEEIDWDQRGGPVVRGDLRQREGDVARLALGDLPIAQRVGLVQHLGESVLVFATDLRDRTLNQEPLPVSATLTDLARPCPECGGWRDWGGTCAACARRAFRRQSLRAEAGRLTKEREEETAEWRKWAERLPIARRRLADADAEMAKLTG